MWMLLAMLASAQELGAESEGEKQDVDEGRPRWTITVDPLTTLLGFVHLQVEGALSDRFSLYAGPSLHLYDPVWQGSSEPYVGIGVEAGFRWFPRAQAPKGSWLMVRGVVARLHTTDGSELVSVGGYGSVLAGYTWILQEHLVLSAGGGVQRIQYGVGDYGIRAFAPALHTNLGVAF